MFGVDQSQHGKNVERVGKCPIQFSIGDKWYIKSILRPQRKVLKEFFFFKLMGRKVALAWIQLKASFYQQDGQTDVDCRISICSWAHSYAIQVMSSRTVCMIYKIIQTIRQSSKGPINLSMTILSNPNRISYYVTQFI